jgi:hypothetical protein
MNVPTISSRTQKEWIEEFRRLRKLNGQIMGTAAPKKAGRKPGFAATGLDADNPR